MRKAGDELLIFRLADGFERSPERTLKLGGTVQSVAFSADGAYLATAHQSGDAAVVQVMELAGGSIVFAQTWSSPPALAFCPDEPLLALAGRDEWLLTWKFLQPYPPPGAGYDDGEPGGNPYVEGGPFHPLLRLLTRAAQGGCPGLACRRTFGARCRPVVAP